MKTIGIIAEYNPFHNGHLYLINELRSKTGADFVIAAISGDFVQRGKPAIYDKYTRTKMALNAGIDLVFELPACFATGSAEDFAACGVALICSWQIWVGIGCYGTSMLLFFYMLSNYKLSSIMPVTCMTYIFNVVIAKVVFGENISRVQVIGIVIIIMGLIVLSRGAVNKA